MIGRLPVRSGYSIHAPALSGARVFTDCDIDPGQRLDSRAGSASFLFTSGRCDHIVIPNASTPEMDNHFAAETVTSEDGRHSIHYLLAWRQGALLDPDGRNRSRQSL
jgi:hypothetical protein